MSTLHSIYIVDCGTCFAELIYVARKQLDLGCALLALSLTLKSRSSLNMDKPFPHLYSDFPGFVEEELTLYDYGYRVLCTILVGSGAICVDLFVYFALSLLKRIIRKRLITEETNFVVDLLFALINLSVTAWLAYFVDRHLRIFWMKRKYGLTVNNSLSSIN